MGGKDSSTVLERIQVMNGLGYGYSIDQWLQLGILHHDKSSPLILLYFNLFVRKLHLNSVLGFHLHHGVSEALRVFFGQ